VSFCCGAVRFAEVLDREVLDREVVVFAPEPLRVAELFVLVFARDPLRVAELLLLDLVVCAISLSPSTFLYVMSWARYAAR
jgi:hypothetical protein